MTCESFKAEDAGPVEREEEFLLDSPCEDNTISNIVESTSSGMVWIARADNTLVELELERENNGITEKNRNLEANSISYIFLV